MQLSYPLSREELQNIIAQLNQSLAHHYAWYDSLIRTLVCGLSPDYHDLDKESHRECRFGQWFYHASPQSLREHESFKAIEEAHRSMHRLAQRLLEYSMHKKNIPTFDYDNFANALERMQLEIQALKIELEDLLHTRDPLTQVINRVNMLPILREQQELVKRTNQACCIAMMDFDHFKNINDTYGHQAGDKVLVASAHYLIQQLRPYDKIFRYGGEEFLLCFPNTELHSALNSIERLRIGIKDLNFDIEPPHTIHITASFGLTLLDPNIPVEESIHRSDQALYTAKSEGRNCVRTWKSDK